jgi:hypothetical protein
MTVYTPRHTERPPGWVDRARARISGWLAALWQPAQWDVVDDDNGEPISDLFDDARLIDPDCRDGKHQSCIGGPCECACHESVNPEAWAYEPDVEPLERQVIHAIQVQGVYLPLTSAPPLDDTVTDWAPRTCARREARARLWQPPRRDQVQQAVSQLMDEYFPRQVTA